MRTEVTGQLFDNEVDHALVHLRDEQYMRTKSLISIGKYDFMTGKSRIQVLLCASVLLVGARCQREHERADPPVLFRRRWPSLASPKRRSNWPCVASITGPGNASTIERHKKFLLSSYNCVINQLHFRFESDLSCKNHFDALRSPAGQASVSHYPGGLDEFPPLHDFITDLGVKLLG